MHNTRGLRLKREEEMLLKESETLTLIKSEENPDIWYIDFVGPKDSIYANEKFRQTKKASIHNTSQICSLTSHLTLLK